MGRCSLSPNEKQCRKQSVKHINKATSQWVKTQAAANEDFEWDVGLTCNRAAIVPQECQSMGARSGTDSRFLLSSSKAFSLVSGLDSSLIHW